MHHDSTDDLVQRWRSGDELATEELYRRYADQLWELAKGQIGQRLGRRIDADDVVQSVFRTFFRRTREGEYPVDRSGSIWQLLVTITINKIRRNARFHNAKRRDVRAECHTANGNGHGLPEMLAELPTDDSAAMLVAEFDELLSGLREPDRTIVQLTLQGFSTSEIGAKVGCSRWTVRRVLDRVGGWLEQRMESDSDK